MVLEVDELVGVDVQLGVPVAVDPQDLGVDAAVLLAGERHHGREQRDGVDGRPSSARSTPRHRWAAAGAKTSRPSKVGAALGEEEVGVGQLDGPGGAAAQRHRRGQQAVVGADEDGGAVADLDRDGPAGGADRGIDHTPARPPGTGRGWLRARARPPAAHVVGGDAVGESTIPTSGAIERITECTTPTNSSTSP